MDLILKDFPHESFDYEEMHPHPQFETHVKLISKIHMLTFSKKAIYTSQINNKTVSE